MTRFAPLRRLFWYVYISFLWYVCSRRTPALITSSSWSSFMWIVGVRIIGALGCHFHLMGLGGRCSQPLRRLFYVYYDYSGRGKCLTKKFSLKWNIADDIMVWNIKYQWWWWWWWGLGKKTIWWAMRRRDEAIRPEHKDCHLPSKHHWHISLYIGMISKMWANYTDLQRNETSWNETDHMCCWLLSLT